MNYMLEYSLQTLAAESEKENKAIWQIALEKQMADHGVDEQHVRRQMDHRLEVMRKAIELGCSNPDKSASGLSGDDTGRIDQANRDKTIFGGTLEAKVIRNALAVAETNARMGRIVAAPTAGSVAGLVEVPCVKRNAFSAIHALAAAEMALAGITSQIPPDEVVDAMKSVGMMMHPDLKETACGGLAATPSARKYMQELNYAINKGEGEIT